jgi:hypothetical protein
MDSILGTLGGLAKKAREVGAQAIEAVDRDGTVRGTYQKGAERTKAYAKIAKLTLEVNGAHEELSRVYAEIGKLYYEQAKDAPEGYFAPLFAQADELAGGIASREAEVKGMKEDLEAEKAAPAIDADIADFEQIVDATENDGASVPGEKDGE